MAAGLPAGVSDLNRALGQAIVNVAQSLDACLALNTMLNDTDRFGGANGLTTSGLYVATDSSLVMASFADMANLYKVAHGQQAQPGASDFFFNAKKLMGVIPL